MSERRKRQAGPARVLILDDHPIVRMGLSQLIGSESDMEVCAEAESGPEALKLAEAEKPDVAVVDLSLREGSGLDFIKDMQARMPDVLLLVLSMHEETFYAERALRAGARGYIAKEEGTEKVVTGIRAIAAGRVYVSERMQERLLRRMVGGADFSESPIDSLTDRELQVFEMLGQGMPTRQVADKLHLSVKTIESHRERIKDKLGADGASDLLKQAIEWVQSRRGT